MIWRNHRQRVRKQAADWYIRMQAPASAQEVEAFESWLALDPAHPRVYAEMDAVMQASGSTNPAPTDTPGGFVATGFRPALALGLLAAALFTAIVISQGTAEPAFAAITNTSTAVRGVRLADGTGLWLDTGARVGVRLSDARREIDVREGRVRIHPATDTRPLAVTAGNVRIAPGATLIDVTAAPGAVTVGALDGAAKVELTAKVGTSADVALQGGTAVTVDAAGRHPATVDRAWPAGRLSFASAPLGHIFALANRTGDPDLAAADGEIAALRVSGVFDLRDTRRLARKLAAALDLRVDDQGSRLVLRR